MRFKRLLFASVAILLVRVLIGILLEYRWYFPADFDESAFLSGRRYTFTGFYPAFFYGHILSSPLAIGLVSFLLFSGDRPRLRFWHRRAGVALVLLVLLFVFPSGLVMARQTYAGPPAALGFGLLAVLTAIATLMTAYHAKARHFAQHRRWAERCFLLLISPLILRLVAGAVIVMDIESLWTYRLNAWLSWLVPLMIYEISRSKIASSLLVTKECANMRSKLQANRRGVTRIEVVVVILVVIVLGALLLPMGRTTREAARRMQCSNNLKQIIVAINSYESTYKHLPSAMSGTGAGATDLSGNANRLSGLVALLPYLEQASLWNQISKELTYAGTEYPAMGPAPWVEDYPPWQTRLPVVLCPSWPEPRANAAPTNYAFCIGDVSQAIHNPQTQRGAFACRMVTKVSSITDGISNTIAIAEIGSLQKRSLGGQAAVDQPIAMLGTPSDCLQLRDSKRHMHYADKIPLSSTGRGARWVDGAAPAGLIATILPPNRPSCAVGGSQAVDGIYSSGSLHAGGAYVAHVDGAVHYIAEHVDAGDATSAPPTEAEFSSAPTPSPFGVWGALGTAAGGDTSASE